MVYIVPIVYIVSTWPTLFSRFKNSLLTFSLWSSVAAEDQQLTLGVADANGHIVVISLGQI